MHTGSHGKWRLYGCRLPKAARPLLIGQRRGHGPWAIEAEIYFRLERGRTLPVRFRLGLSISCRSAADPLIAVRSAIGTTRNLPFVWSR